jgi:hypothetical protein
MSDGFERPEEVWLLNLGYVSAHSEQNLMLYGYLAAPGVRHVEMMIDVRDKEMKYAVVLETSSYRRYKLERWLESKSGLLGKLGLLCFLRVSGSYDPGARIARCVKDYAGPQWKTSTEVLSVSQYQARVSKGRAQGWFFKDGIDESPGTPGQSGQATSSSPSS